MCVYTLTSYYYYYMIVLAIIPFTKIQYIGSLKFQCALWICTVRAAIFDISSSSYYNRKPILPTVLANEIFDNALKLALSFNSIINCYLAFIIGLDL